MSNVTAGLAAFEAKSYYDAFTLLKPLAERGDAEAQCIVANMYHLGLGLERDVLEAVKWYKTSAAQGYSVASNNLGTISTIGDRDVAVDKMVSESSEAAIFTHPQFAYSLSFAILLFNYV